MTPEERKMAADALAGKAPPPPPTYAEIHAQQMADDAARGFGAPATTETPHAANGPTSLPDSGGWQPPVASLNDQAPPEWKRELAPPAQDIAPATNGSPAPAPPGQPVASPVLFGAGAQSSAQGQPSGQASYHFAPPAVGAARPTYDVRPEEAAQADVNAAGDELAAAQRQKAADVGGARDEARLTQQAMQQAQQDAQAKTQQGLSDLRARLQQKVDAHEKESIDPDHYWADKGQGARAFATISMMLSNAFGGFAAGFQGREFHPDKTLSEAIDRDIAAQKMAYEGKQKAIDNDQNLYAQNMAAFQDDKAADAAARAEHWTMLEQQIQAIADKGQGAVDEATVKQTRAMAAQQAAKAQDELATRFHLITTKSAEADAQKKIAAQMTARGGGAAAAKPGQQGAPQYEARPVGKGDEARIMSLPDGSRIWVPIENDKNLILSGKLTPAQAHAMHVTDNPAGGLALTNRPYTGESTLPGKPGSDKTSPRVAFKQEAAEQLGGAIDQLEKLEKGDWEPFGKPHQKGAELVGEIRNLLSEAGVDPREYIPEDYNPTEIHGGAKAAIPEILRGIVARRKAGVERVVERTKGVGESEAPEP